MRLLVSNNLFRLKSQSHFIQLVNITMNIAQTSNLKSQEKPRTHSANKKRKEKIERKGRGHQDKQYHIDIPCGT